MGLVNMIRNGMRSFLRLEKAQPNSIIIREEMTFEDNAAKNRIWYRGMSYELSQLYSQLPTSKTSFWGSHSTPGQEIRKIHVGLPGIIVKSLRNIVLGDMNGFEFKDAKQETQWEAISKDNDFEEQLKTALKDTLVVGDGCFRISFDSTITNLPILEWISGDRIKIIQKRGRFFEVVFVTRFDENRQTYTLEETYGYGYIHNKLYRGENEVELTATEYTRSLSDYTFDKRLMLCVPFKIFESDIEKGRGESIFDRKTDTFDSLDETWSQWMDALRAGRTKEYIPESLIPRDPNTGVLMKPNAFDNRFIAVGDDVRETGKQEIYTSQATIQHDGYLATYITALDLAMQGLISPATLGIDVKKLDNAEAQREKEKATLYTRNSIVEALQKYLPRLIDMTLNSFNVLTNKPIEDVTVDIPFGEYANPSFESQVETVSKAKTGGIMSIEASIEELYGDTKDDSWKAEEVQRLKNEQGISEVEEPRVNTELGNFSVERSEHDEDSTDHAKDISNDEQASKGAAQDE